MMLGLDENLGVCHGWLAKQPCSQPDNSNGRGKGNVSVLPGSVRQTQTPTGNASAIAWWTMGGPGREKKSFPIMFARENMRTGFSTSVPIWLFGKVIPLEKKCPRRFLCCLMQSDCWQECCLLWASALNLALGTEELATIVVFLLLLLMSSSQLVKDWGIILLVMYAFDSAWCNNKA